MKQKYKFRVLLATIIALAASIGATAQVTNVDYFMESSYLRSSMNPALRPTQGYLVIPLLPNVGAKLRTNSLNMDNLTFPMAGGGRTTFMNSEVTSEEFLSNLKDDNFLTTDVAVKLFGLGFFKGDNFWTVDLGTRIHADANIPKDVFRLLKNGFSETGNQYDIKELNATVNGFVELGIGYSRPFLDKSLTVGIKGKLLAGIADFDLNADKFMVEATPNAWKARTHVVLQGSAPGLSVKNKMNNNQEVFDTFEFDKFEIPGWGAGVDVGAEYNLGKTLHLPNDLKISAALTDLGFISWSKNSSVLLESKDTEITVDMGNTTINDGSSLNDVFNDAFDKLKEATDLHSQDNKARTTSLRSTMNLGAQYEILANKLSAGILYSNRFGKYFNTAELVASVNFAPAHWFSASAGYSFSDLDTFGAAIHLAPSKGLRLFVATDYVILHRSSDFLPTTSKGVNFEAGISIPLGAKRKSNAPVVAE